MDILKNRVYYISISLFFIILSLYFLFFTKLNLGIDMTWGVNMEYSYENSIDLEKAKIEIEKEKKSIIYNNQEVINNISVYSITWENSIDVVWGFITWINEKNLEALKKEFRENTLEILKSQDSTISETKYTNIWKSFWDYIKNTAFITLSIAIVMIALYIAYAFSGVVSGISAWSFWIITLFTLFHDVLVASGFYIIFSIFYPDFQIDTFFITALLTILWYSINDTIVIFDRIRWNLKQYAWKTKNWKSLSEIINLSINQTLKRSIYTSLTLIFVLFTIFFFWPETLKWFILVMILWTFIWTYSSIFLASPLLYQVNKNKKLKVYKKKVINPEDKIVV